MAYNNIHGTQIVFGFTSSTDAPTIATGFLVRSGSLSYAPEVYSEAKDGEGYTEAIAISKVENRAMTGTFTGYINTSLGTTPFGANAIGNSFNFMVNGVSRKFFVKSIGEPRSKGEFVEVSVEVYSTPFVTPASATS